MQTGIPPKGPEAIEFDPYRNGQLTGLMDFIPYMSGLYTYGNSTSECIKIGDTSYHRDYRMLNPDNYFDGQVVPVKLPVGRLQAEVSYQGTIYFTIDVLVHTKIHRLQATDTSGGGGPGLDFYFSFEYFNISSTMYDNDPPRYFAALDEDVNITHLEHVGDDYIEVPIIKTNQKPLNMERPSPSAIVIEKLADNYSVYLDTVGTTKPRRFMTNLFNLFKRKKGNDENLNEGRRDNSID